MNSTIPVVSGTIRTARVERPSLATIIDRADRATRAGISLAGSGPVRCVRGGIAYVVGITGCTCPLGVVGEWCQHRSLLTVSMGLMPTPKPAPAPIPVRPRRERRGWQPNDRRHVWPVRPVMPIHPRPTITN